MMQCQNRSCSVDADFQEVVAIGFVAFLPTKAADRMMMG